VKCLIALEEVVPLDSDARFAILDQRGAAVKSAGLPPVVVGKAARPAETWASTRPGIRSLGVDRRLALLAQPGELRGHHP
jgi:hypothetical protein